MPYREIPLMAGYCYHIYNRGNNHSKIFFDERNYDFLLRRFRENIISAGEVICFCLMPTHYHFLIRIIDEIKFIKMMNRTFISYSKAINKAYNRSGHLFDGRYRFKLVPRNDYLLHLSRYIHLNPVRAGLVDKPEDWKYSSYQVYLLKKDDAFTNYKIITDLVDDYEKFVLDLREEKILDLTELLFN